jgi:ribose transport system substrate-binding protein
MERRSLARLLAAATVLVVTACGGGSTAPGAAKTAAAVAIVPGGPHPYFEPMRQAITDATTDFHLSKGTFAVPTDWKQDLQNQLLTSLASQGYDGFGMFPTDGNAANGIVGQLAAKNDPVVAVGGCVQEPTKTTFCLATDTGGSAYIGAQAAIKAMGGKGVLLHGTGLLTDPNTQKRVEAVKKAVAETNGAVTLITLSDIDKDAQTADTAINQALAAHKDITGIITSAYNPTIAAAKALRTLGDKRIKMVGIDDDPITLAAVKDGFLIGTMGQNPYGQAYVGADAINQIHLGCKKRSDAPYFIDTGTMLIGPDKVATYQDDFKAQTKTMAASFKAKYLSC